MTCPVVIGWTPNGTLYLDNRFESNFKIHFNTVHTHIQKQLAKKGNFIEVAVTQSRYVLTHLQKRLAKKGNFIAVAVFRSFERSHSLDMFSPTYKSDQLKTGNFIEVAVFKFFERSHGLERRVYLMYFLSFLYFLILA